TRGQAGQRGPEPPRQAMALQDPPVQQGPMMVTQTHARHILIKTTKVMSDTKAQTTLSQLRQRIANGESFEDLAKRYSEDVTAPQGGDVGWVTAGDTVRAFEQAMEGSADGQVSEPVRSQFGWHLIQVLERRTKNMEKEFQRMQA